MHEYWWSARKAFLELLDGQENTSFLSTALPETFRQLRPWVHHGWEMVLLAAEMFRPSSPLQLLGIKAFTAQYQYHCNEALKTWNWEPNYLQAALEKVRQDAIINDRKSWLSLHQPFPGIIQRIHQLDKEGMDWAVLTTKGKAFTSELLDSFQLHPKLIYGHEAGNKVDMLIKLKSNFLITGFVEDRRATLETVLNTPALRYVPCYLASWGYLKPKDQDNLPPNIHLLKPETLATPLASWT